MHAALLSSRRICKTRLPLQCLRASLLLTTADSNIPRATYVTSRLDALVESGRLSSCPPQVELAQKLDKLAKRSLPYEQRLFAFRREASIARSRAAESQPASTSAQDQDHAPTPPSVPRGLYIHGSVGAGKSMLLDVFFAVSPCRAKARYHFHDFMSRVHRELHQYNQHRLSNNERAWHVSYDPQDDSVVAVGRKLAHEHWLIAFDEFQVTDVADALLMSRLFKVMWNEGAVLVATSNRPPDDLYQNGLNRELFLPFIQSLQHRCQSLHLDVELDWRRQQEQTSRKWAEVNSCTSSSDVDLAVGSMLGCTYSRDSTPLVQVPLGGGRCITLRRQQQSDTPGKHVYVADFDSLCVDPVSPADIKLLLADASGLVVTAVPHISQQNSDWARRFIHLVDQAYEARIPLFVVSASSPQGVLGSFLGERPGRVVTSAPAEQKADAATMLDPAGVSHITEEAEAAALDEICFAADRALSRLHEMATVAYAAPTHAAHENR